MLLNSTQGIASSQVEEESLLLRRKIEDQNSLLRGKVEELNQNTVLLIAEAEDGLARLRIGFVLKLRT
jgi:hypothetical protein